MLAGIEQGERQRSATGSPPRTGRGIDKPVDELVNEALALNLRKRLRLKPPEFARLLPVSVGSLPALESGTPATEAVGRRLIDLQWLAHVLTDVIQQESLGAWLQPSQRRLRPTEAGRSH